MAFYDGPTPPKGTFDDLLSIPSLTHWPSYDPVTKLSTSSDLTPSGWKTRTMIGHFKAFPPGTLGGHRAVIHSASVQKMSPAIVAKVKQLCEQYRAQLPAGSSLYISLEPFLDG